MIKFPLIILSLGAGVQSTAMCLMAMRGEFLSDVYCAIFADTKDEPKKVYDHLAWLMSVLNFVVHIVSKGSLMDENIRLATSKKSGRIYMNGKIPAFLLSPNGKPGLLGRRCTPDFKIEPIHKKCVELVGRDHYLAWRRKHKDDLKQWSFQVALRKQKSPHYDIMAEMSAFKAMQDDALVVMWIGISTDEADRCKPSQKPWIRNEWPLIESGISRNQCVEWMSSRGYPEAPRSACKKCPFHSDDEWAKQTPEEFQESIAYEKKMQDAARQQEVIEGIPYLHSSCVPLDKVKLKTTAGYQQLGSFSNACEGLCGV